LDETTIALYLSDPGYEVGCIGRGHLASTYGIGDVDPNYHTALGQPHRVIYTSDHGSHFRTRNEQYERSCHDPSIRFPRIACGPGFRGGGVIRELVSLIEPRGSSTGVGMADLVSAADARSVGAAGIPSIDLPDEGDSNAFTHHRVRIDAGDLEWLWAFGSAARGASPGTNSASHDTDAADFAYCASGRAAIGLPPFSPGWFRRCVA